MKPPDVIERALSGRSAAAGTARRVADGGALGALPGLLLGVVPMVLAELDVISSDQSQIGFVGVPLLVLGALVGVVIPASKIDMAGTALVGAVVGLVVGAVVGLLLVAGIQAFGVTIGGVWLLTTPIGMVAGAALAVRTRLAARPSG